MARLIAPTSTGDAGRDLGVHQNRQVGSQIAAQNSVQFENWLTAQLASPALIGFARIGESVAENYFSPTQSGKNDFLDVLLTRGEHQRQLSHWIERRCSRVEQQLANFISRRGATGFARDRHFETLLPQLAREPLQLRAFAASIETFEGDKPATPRTHREIITARVPAQPGVWLQVCG